LIGALNKSAPLIG